MKILSFCIGMFLALSPAWADTTMEVLTKPITKKNIVDINRNVIAQQFDFDKSGNIYYAHFGYKKDEFQTKILRIPQNKRNVTTELTSYRGDSMTLYYACHPTGMAIEDGKDGPYVWICSYTNRLENNRYNMSQTIARIKYQPNKCLFPYDKECEHFWFPHKGNLNVAMDEKNDLVAFSFYYPGDDYHKLNIDPNRARRVRIYKLSEALATPLEEMTLPEKWVRGGDNAPDKKCDTLTVTLKVHNLSRIKPVAEMGTHSGGNNPEKINSTAWQGFDIDNGIVWFSEGTARVGSFVTGYDYEGNIVFHRTKVQVSCACPEWDKWKFGNDEFPGNENEGVKVWKGHLYLDQFSVGPDHKSRTNIFKFPLPKK